jgi:hypothetical protein
MHTDKHGFKASLHDRKPFTPLAPKVTVASLLAITRAMEKAGLKADFIQGQRVTDEATVRIVDEVLSREINPEIVRTINALGGQAVGFAGPDNYNSILSISLLLGGNAAGCVLLWLGSKLKTKDRPKQK